MKTKLFKYIAVLALLSLPYFANAQLTNTNWYFGIQSGLNFNDGTLPPTVLTNSMMSTEWSAASVSDDLGNLLFYTNGKSIWNSAHQIMANGNNIMGNTNISQAVNIVPVPDDPNRYYVFSNAGNEMGFTGISYSVVDMTLNAGLGDVEASNKNILLQENSTIRLTSVSNPTDNSYWLILFSLGIDSIDHDTFYVYRIDETGITLTSTTPFTFPFPASDAAFSNGQIKISPDGQTLALVNNTVEKVGKVITDAQSIFTFDFDSSTGAISSINNSIDLTDNLYSYGVEFSPNSNLLYVSGTNRLSDGAAVGRVYQVDYRNMGSTTTLLDNSNPIYGLQVAIDNKIYAANFDGNIDVINAPDVLGSGALYTSDAILIGGAGGREFPQGVPSKPIAPKTVLNTFNTQFANDTITRVAATNDGLVVFGQVGADNTDNLPGAPESFVATYDQNGNVIDADIVQTPYTFDVTLDENTFNWEALRDGTSLNGEINKNYKLSKYDNQNNLTFEITTTNINEELIENESSQITFLVFPTTSYQDYTVTGSSGRTWTKSATQTFANDGTYYIKALHLARFDAAGILIDVRELLNYRWYRTSSEGTVAVNYPAKIVGDNNTLYFTVAARDEGTFTEAAKIYLTNGEFHKKGEWLIGYDIRNNVFTKAKLIGQNGSVTPNELIYNQSTLFRKRKNKLYKLDGNLTEIDSLIQNKLTVFDANSDDGSFIVLGDNTRTLKKIDSNLEEVWSENLGRRFTIIAASEATSGEVFYAASYDEEAKLFDDDGDITIPHNSGNDVFIGRFVPPTTPMMSAQRNNLLGNNSEITRERQRLPEENYSVFPNPFDDSFAIRSKSNNYTIAIYDAFGKLVLTKSISANPEGGSQFKTSDLKKGIYTVKITDDQANTYFKKIIKN